MITLALRRTFPMVSGLAMMCLASAAFAQAHPGFGEDSRAPVGAPLQLPPGLELAGPIIAADDDGNCPDKSLEAVGSGLWVRVCVPVRNSTGGVLTTEFPPGLVIVSRGEGFQHGLLVEETVVPVPPIIQGGGGRRREDEEKDEPAAPRGAVYIPFHLYCINSSKSGSAPGARYAMGPVSAHPALAELYRLLRSNALKGDGEKVETVQNIIFEVIEHGRLTDEHRALISAL